MAEEKIKEELRRNDGRGKEKNNLEEDMKAGQEKIFSGSVVDQHSEIARKSIDGGGGGSDQHKLQAPVECDIPRTPTPDYADLNARFILEIAFLENHQHIVGLKISWV